MLPARFQVTVPLSANGYSAPIAWAASSITGTPYSSASRPIRPMSAHWP